MMANLFALITTLFFLTILATVDATSSSNGQYLSPFADLSVDEMNEVIEYLYSQKHLNLVPPLHATLGDGFIYMIEALRPNKTDVLKYLDESGPIPQRSAKVILFRANLPTPIIQEYRVFPIPQPANLELIVHPNWTYPIPYTSRTPYTIPQLVQIGQFMEKELSKVEDLIAKASDGYVYRDTCTQEKCLSWTPGLPSSATPYHQRMMFYLTKKIEGPYIHPIGVQFLINMDSIDVSEWSVDRVWFQGQNFDNFDHLLEEYTANNLEINRVPEPEGVNGPTLRSSLNFRGDPRPKELKRGPRTYMPDGDRYEVNGRSVKWLGWEFEFSMLASTGFQLHDIRFLEERIVYELSLQEIGVFYSGGSPLPRHSIFFDSFINLGVGASELFNGIDCPKHARFFDFIHYTVQGQPMLFRNRACIFEHDLGTPLRRRVAERTVAQGLSDNVLIVRHVVTVGNYDYVIDVNFHQGGQIETKISLSGYMLNTYYTGPSMDPYGHVVNVNTSFANIHHHVINFKADLDILGRNNRFHTLDISVREEPDTINAGYSIYSHIFKRDLKETEKEATYKFNFDTPKYLIISNEDHSNEFGYSRGYRILSEGMSKMLLPDDYRGHRSRSWTKYQFAVTKQNEDERFSSSNYATMEPYKPVMSFQDFIDDNENIVDKDLVAWISLGTHHIPHSEDVPNVLTPGAQLRFYLLPYNYFNEDPSLASRDNIRVTTDGKSHYDYQFSGFVSDHTVYGGPHQNSSCSGPRGDTSSALSFKQCKWSVMLTAAFFISRILFVSLE